MSFAGRILYHYNLLRKHGLSSTWHRQFTRPKIWDARPQPCDAETTTPSLHVVAGTDYVDLSAWMLASWIQATEQSWDVWYHDDGTLSSTQKAHLARRFPGIRIIERSEADARTEPHLSQAPAVRAYRQKSPLALKFLDTFVFAPRSRHILIDPDILFFQKPEFILSWCQNETDDSNWFNKDPLEPAPYTPESCQETFGFPIWERVNSGLCLLNQDLFDTAFWESCFRDPIFQQSKLWRMEQTCLALAASRQAQGGLLPTGYDITLEPKMQENAVARHYLGAVRHHFWGEGVAQLKTPLGI